MITIISECRNGGRMREKDEIVAELVRVAKFLASDQVSQTDFDKHGNMSVSGVCYVFGSWNRAIEAAGLIPFEFGPGEARHAITPDIDLMEEVVRLTKELRKRPTDREMASFGKYSPRPYVKRWGTYAKGREAAYEKLGFPVFE